MKRFFAVLSLLTILLLSASPVEAHAELVRSNPSPGSTLETAPTEITLEFTEDLDVSFSRIRLLDSTNTVINAGPGEIDSANPKILKLTPGALANGTYTALWRVRSSDDGHVTEGSVPFGVGVPVAQASLIPPLGTPDPATETPPPASSLIRWLGLLAAAAMLGIFPFALFVWRPVYLRSSDERRVIVDSATGYTMRRIAIVSGFVLLLASALFLIDQAAIAADTNWLGALGTPLMQLLASRTGWIVIGRLVLTALIMVLAWRMPPPGAGAIWFWWLGIGLGSILLLSFSLNGHAAAEQQNAVLAIVLDWVHLAATTAWIGGLVPLVAVLAAARRGKDQTLPLGNLIPRFSLVAALSVVALLISGLYSYFIHIGDLHLLLDTTYGRALSVKSALFVLLIIFGAWNLLVLSPALRKSGTRLAGRFWRTVIAEFVLGAAVLLAVGAMTSVAPSETAWAEHQRLGEVQEIDLSGVNMRVQVAPAQIGDNEFAVDIHDTRPNAQDKPAKVLLRFNMVGMEMGQVESETTTSDTQRYVARGSYLSMGGRWNVEVILRRAGFEDVRHTFQMDIVRSSQP